MGSREPTLFPFHCWLIVPAPVPTVLRLMSERCRLWAQERVSHHPFHCWSLLSTVLTSCTFINFMSERRSRALRLASSPHPFHCWTTLPYVADSQLSAQTQGNTVGYGPAALHPFHCWSVLFLLSFLHFLLKTPLNPLWWSSRLLFRFTVG